MSFALINQLWMPDLLVELGGGCDHNLTRVSRGSMSSLLKKTHLLNGELSPEGISLSNMLFKYYNIKNAYSTKFDCNAPEPFFKKIAKYSKGKNVHLTTVASIEHITYLDFEFMKELKNLSEYCENLLVSFCEPITWQYANLINEELALKNLLSSSKAKHNTNLWPVIQRSARELDTKICKISPSLFRQSESGLDLSGIQITF